MMDPEEASGPGLNSPAADAHPSSAAGATSWASRLNPNARTFIMPSEAEQPDTTSNIVPPVSGGPASSPSAALDTWSPDSDDSSSRSSSGSRTPSQAADEPEGAAADRHQLPPGGGWPEASF